jgi:hypothetical protein
VVAAEEYLQHSSSVVNEDGLFISGPAVVEILHDNRPIDRCFGFLLMRVMVLLPQPEVAEYPFYELRVIDEADNLHFIRASGATERAHFPATRLRGHKPFL